MTKYEHLARENARLRRENAELRHRESIRKARLTAVLLTVLIMSIPTASVIQDYTRRTEWESTREIKTVYVNSGDSIDGYWAEYAPSWMDRSDYREAIKELNGIDSCYLYAGQTLKLYVEGGN